MSALPVSPTVSATPATPASPATDSLHLHFHSRRRNVSVRAIDVLYIESLSDHTLIHRVHGNPLKNTVKISEWESRLPSFLRIHRSFLVNPAHATYSGSVVEVQGAQTLTISRSYKEAVKKHFTPES